MSILIVGGLVCGAVLAHFFADRLPPVVMKASPLLPEPASPPPAIASTAPAEPPVLEAVTRERDLSDSFLRQSAMETEAVAAAGPSLPEASDVPRFAKYRKPAIPAAEAPTPAVSAAAPPRSAMSTFLPAAQYPASEWRKAETQAGAVDAVTVAATGEKVGNAMLKATDTIEVSGWVGDPSLGLRFKNVLFSVCGKIVGHTVVNASRPDVAKTVHPNLTPSGWQARLYVGYLPNCAVAALQVLGVVPGSVTVLAVGAPVPLRLPPPAKPPSGTPSGAQVFTPKSVVPARFVAVEILPDTAELRRCGAATCNAVGQVSKGRHQAFVAEEGSDGWVLLIFPDKAGWVPRTQIVWNP